MTHHNLSFTYKPKIEGVKAGAIRQTIRIGRRFKVGDRLLLFGWEGKPYRSKWAWRKSETVQKAIDIKIYPWGLELPIKEPVPHLFPFIWNMATIQVLAILDGIDPPSGWELGRVLCAFHKIPKLGVEAQIIRW